MKACPQWLGGMVGEPIDQDELVLASGDEGIDKPSAPRIEGFVGLCTRC